jgi:ribulose-5-phosphate 4-epimerase/fuculose-1-phosphate aldolase
MTEDALRDRIAKVARSLYDRGLTHGSTGNISARLPDGRWLVTPTGSSFGLLDASRISLLDEAGTLLAGDTPSKETFLHRAMYRQRPRAAPVVHLHATHSVAVSVLADIDPADVLPPAHGLLRDAHRHAAAGALPPDRRPGADRRGRGAAQPLPVDC